MATGLSDERCPNCAKKLEDYDHMWFQCQECGYLLFGDSPVIDLDEDGDNEIDWMEGYEDE